MLEDMLPTCVIDFGVIRDQQLALVEFAYNNNFHSSIQMASFEALYCKRCRSPIRWFYLVVVESMGIDVLRDDLECVRLIQSRLEIA